MMRDRFAALAALGAALLFAAGCKDRNPNTPIVRVTTPGTVGGRAVPIEYVLRNPDTKHVEVEVKFSVDRGKHFSTATPAPGSEGTVNLEASPGGTRHSFLWNALEDLGPGRHERIVMKIAPKKSGHRGTSDRTSGFTVDNTDLFVRVADLGTARGRTGAAETPEGGAIVAGGAGFAGTAEALDLPLLALEARAAIAGPRDAPQGATLLDVDGGTVEPRPVFAGGEAPSAVLALEVYDSDGGPGTWIEGALSRPRTGHTILRLATGTQALVAGGRSANGTLLAADEVVTLGDPIDTADVNGTGASRTGHTATLLPDGRVLIAGGTTDAATATDSTLVYDPETNAYSSGPSLVFARAGHAAALVGEKIVIFGGHDATGKVLRSAEIADAIGIDSASFRLAAGEMTAPRERFSATALGTTEVLLAGGSDGTKDLASAERFSLEGETFTSTRNGLEVARSGHAAVAFGTGRVFVAGGGTAAVEVYIPPSRKGSQTFDPEATSLPEGRAEHAGAALADGRVLITGGTNGVVVSGGRLFTLESAEIYNPHAPPGTPRVLPTGSLQVARRGHSATALEDGRVLIAGGFGTSGAGLSSAELYDPGAGTFATIGDMPAAIAEHTATLLADGRVLLAGGSETEAAGFLFDGTSFSTVTLRSARRRHTATRLADGRVLLAGGLSNGTPLETTEIFDPASNTSTDGPALPVPLVDHRAVLLTGGDVLLTGGRSAVDGAPRSDVFRITPEGAIVPLDPLPAPRADHVAIALANDKVLLVGGIGAAAPAGAPDLAAPVLAGALVYDARTETAAPPADPDMARARRGAIAIPLSDGRFVISGGRDEAGAVVAGFEVFSP